MKIIVFFLTSVLTINYSIAQSINDSTFNNVTLIEKGDVTQNNNDYLIDVVMNFNVGNIPVVFNDARLPKYFFLNKLFKSKAFILITPDWEYYNKIADEATKMGISIEPITMNFFYQRKYIQNKSKVDSIKISGNQPKIIFNTESENLNATQSIVVYHTESFGSTCCPKDPKWEMEEKLYEFIAVFENANDIKIGDTYKKITGKEGEHILYFTLSNLNIIQKLIFLKEIQYCFIENKNRKEIEFSSQVFMPFSVKKERLQLISIK